MGCGKHGFLRSAANALFVAFTFAGAFILTICVAATAETVARGYPSLFGTGYTVFSAADGSVLPDETLIAFEPCAASEIGEGGWAVYRSARGMRAGAVVAESDSHIAVRTSAAEVTAAVKAVTTKPVYMKLSPNVTDIVSIAKACEEAGADGISLINTILGMRIDLRTKKPVIANKMGGFSGSAILPVALRMVYQVYEAVKIPVIGMGGVSSAEDVIEMMLAGATAVEVGAANLVNPYACRDIIAELPRVMEKYRINNLTDIIGGAHHG